MRIIKTANFDRLASDPMAGAPTDPMAQPSMDPMSPMQGHQMASPAGLPPKQPKPPKMPFEVCELGGMPIEDALSEFINEVAGDYVTHDNDGIGDYEAWGYKGHDAGSDYSYIEGLTVGVDLTGSEYEQDPDNVPHTQHGSVTVHDHHNEMDMGSDVEWTATLSGVQQHGGKHYAIYNVS